MNQVAPDKWKPALIGGVVMGVLSALPLIGVLNCACCILVIGGGVMASYLYQKDFPLGSIGPTMGDGALVGLMAGVVGAVVDTLVSIPVSLIGIGASQLEHALETIRTNPDIPPELVGFLEAMVAGGAVGVGLIIAFVMSLVIFSIFGTLGGILGIALFQKGGGSPPPSTPAGGPPTSPPPPVTPQSPPPSAPPPGGTGA